MKKIPSLFKRDYEGNRQVYDEVVPGCEWVLAGEGVPTVKWDGTSVLIEDGRAWKRYEVKKGKPVPDDFKPGNPEPDPTTGKWAGWRPVSVDDPGDRWHVEALNVAELPPDGTYELVGPKVQGNPHNETEHRLIRHGADTLTFDGRSFDAVRDYLSDMPIEGVVWHNSDGRMAKIKRRDFGLSWPI